MTEIDDFKAADRAEFAGTLFSGVHQRQNFCRMHELFPFSHLVPSPTPHAFATGDPVDLPGQFHYDGETIDTEQFLESTSTAALVVVHDGLVRLERYETTGGPAVPWLSMSVAKSFVATLVGIAVDEGHISSIEDPIDTYVPEVLGSAYEGVRIKDLLQMSSGAAWNEDYSDPDSDVARLGRGMNGNGTFAELVAGVTAETDPGTLNRYNSAETQALGFLVSRATDQPLTDYMQAKLWDPLGMNHDAYWIVDSAGVEMAFGGLNASALDYARLGELHRLGGLWQGERIVSAEWVSAATTPDAPHVMPNRPDDPDFGLGYGYQWWVPGGNDGEFMAIGVYNQLIHVNPTAGTVIVKLSANPTYGVLDDEEHNRELASIELFRAITAQCSS